jgi:hypothetical protein
MKKTLLALAAATTLFAGTAYAAPGDTLGCDITGGGAFSCSSATAVQGPGVEFKFGNMPNNPYFNVNMTGNLLVVRALKNNSLGATILNLTDLTQAFTSFDFLGEVGFSGLTASDVSLTNGVLSVDMRDTSSVRDAFYTIRLGNTPAGVPEPAAWGMMIGGFGLAGAAMRRRQTKVSFA